MPILTAPDLEFDVDAVLRGQGADPAAIRARRPKLVETAERALEEGRALLRPQTLYRELQVKELRHERLVLENGAVLSGELVSKHLSSAKKVVLFLCTIGDALETRASQVFGNDLVFGLALEGVGSAAVEALANAACSHFEAAAAGNGLHSSIPISPGMLGWPVTVGQPEIFAILKAEEINVSLSEYGFMLPRKSLTAVLGFGEDVQIAGKTCDYCSMREVCRYQDKHGSINTSYK
jgi:hypothetical protein